MVPRILKTDVDQRHNLGKFSIEDNNRSLVKRANYNLIIAATLDVEHFFYRGFPVRLVLILFHSKLAFLSFDNSKESYAFFKHGNCVFIRSLPCLNQLNDIRLHFQLEPIHNSQVGTVHNLQIAILFANQYVVGIQLKKYIHC